MRESISNILEEVREKLSTLINNMEGYGGLTEILLGLANGGAAVGTLSLDLVVRFCASQSRQVAALTQGMP